MKAIILAAGAGRRLGLDHPKCMVEVGGMSIIQRQLRALRANGVEEFVFVVGFEHDQLRAHLQVEPGRFTFINNERFAETNTIYSLHLAREHLIGSVFQLNADVVFDHCLVARLLEEPASSVAIVAHPCGHEEVKVRIEDSRVRAIGKQLAPEDCAGEFIGVAHYRDEVARALAAALAEWVERMGMINDYFESALNDVCGREDIHAVDVSDLPCIEVDFPQDLELARGRIAPLLEADP